MAAATRLAGATLDDGRRVDVHLAEGRIAAIEPAGSASAGEEVVDLAGRLLCPAFVDGHIHRDKTLLGLDWLPHLPGSSVAGISDSEYKMMNAVKPHATMASIPAPNFSPGDPV